MKSQKPDAFRNQPANNDMVDQPAISSAFDSKIVMPITQQAQNKSSAKAAKVTPEIRAQGFNPSDFLRNSIGNLATQKINIDKQQKMAKKQTAMAFNKRQELIEKKSQRFTIEGLK
jgi:hypothetical protein